MRSGIRQTIKKAFRHSAEPWFPGLADRLTEIGWQRLAGREFFLANYGTHRWLRDNPSAERRDIAELALGGRRECRVEVLPPSSRRRYEKLGLVFGSPASVAEDISAVDSAMSFIALAPTLHEAVIAYLSILHILQAPSVDHDVSHSDPEVPFSIFLSVPSLTKDGRVRLAESIIHECMHLQLTMIESVEPLVGCEDELSFSPWQRGLRPLGGVLHGLYVFAVIYAYYRSVQQAPSLTSAEKRFIDKRRRELIEEARDVGDLTAAGVLTIEGQVLFRRLLRQFGSDDSPSAQIVVSHGAKC